MGITRTPMNYLSFAAFSSAAFLSSFVRTGSKPKRVFSKALSKKLSKAV
jgi:hypothetical protein